MFFAVIPPVRAEIIISKRHVYIRLISPYLHLWFWPFVLRGIGRGRQDISLSHLNFATGLTSDSKISTTYGKSVAIGSHLFLSASRHSCDCFACSLSLCVLAHVVL